MKSALIIGGDSTIGTALAPRLKAQNINVYTTSKRKNVSRETFLLNLADRPDSWPKLPQTDVAFLCAGVTKLEACENDPEGTKIINISHMQVLITSLLARGTYVVFISSNQVFDGKKASRKTTDPVSPVNEYGCQKAFMEDWILSQKNAASVLRITKVISEKLPVLTNWERDLKAGKTVEAFDDLAFAPLPISQVIDGLILLGEKKPRGIYHLSGAREISYYEIALALAKKLDISPEKIIPISAKTKGIRAEFLPKYGTLEPSEIFSKIICPEPLEVLGV